MAKDADQIVIRLAPDTIARLDALAARMTESGNEIAAASGPRGVTRSLVVRLAIDHALPALEARYAPAKGTKSTKRSGR